MLLFQFALLTLVGFNGILSQEETSGDLGSLVMFVFRVSDCDGCGAKPGRGHLNIKLCGGSPDPCCGVVNIGAASNGFDEGRIVEYTGSDLADCENYSLDRASLENFDMTLYHEGSDDLQLDWVDIETTFTNIRCNIGRPLHDSTYKLEYCSQR